LVLFYLFPDYISQSKMFFRDPGYSEKFFTIFEKNIICSTL